MTALALLVVIGIFQGVFLVLLAVFLIVRRQVDRVRRSELTATRAELSEPLSAWLAGNGGVAPFVEALRRLPGSTAVAVTGHLVRTAIPSTERAELARALRGETWVQRALAGGASRRWDRRLECARCLGFAGSAADGGLLESLLADVRPAVSIAAVGAIPLVGDARLVGAVLDRMVSLPTVVRQYLQATLREMRTLVEPALTERLQRDTSAQALSRWTELAGVLELPSSLDRVAELEGHPSADVRGAVAHALRRVPRRQSVDVLLRLLRDDDAIVRAAAAHALGELASPLAIPNLLMAARDTVYNVRYRAIVALAQLGEPGRAAVRSLRGGSDRYASEMATLIAGLGDGALLDMTEA